ncbi:MAG: hypothetical protein GXP62_05620, partial [Oligoflexia bacterium]|nr:hypothetical protein [Oligoflexia bacterium]
AIRGNTIPKEVAEDQEKAEQRIFEHCRHVRTGAGTPVGEIVTTIPVADLPQAKHAKVVDAQAQHSGTAEQLWEKLLDPQGAALTAAEVNQVKAAVQIGQLSLAEPQMISHLQTAVRSGSSDEPDLGLLAEKSESDWATLISDTLQIVPEGLTADPEDPASAKQQAYAAHLFRTVEALYPTRRIGARLDTEFSGEEESNIKAFLAQNKTFCFQHSDLQTYLLENSGAIDGLGDAAVIKEQVLKWQRVFRCLPPGKRLDPLRALLAAGVTSAQSIVKMGYASFMDRLAPDLGGPAKAIQVWKTAIERATTTQLFMAGASDSITGATIPGATPNNSSEQSSWTQMFGNTSFCQCEHCGSVHGPAAYLAHLLDYLAEGPRNTSNKSPLQVLLHRRPDIEHLELSCVNTNTLMPYIDLAIEVMENTVAPLTLQSQWEALQTTRSADELAAMPEHENAAAYATLKAAPYPWRLPFDKDREEVWPLHRHLGYSRAEWRRVLSGYAQESEAGAALDQLGVSEVERRLMFGLDLTSYVDTSAAAETDAGVEAEDLLWGMPGNANWADVDSTTTGAPGLRTVSTFLRQATFDGPGTPMELATLEQLLATRLLRNANVHASLPSIGGLEISFDASQPCSLSGAKIEGRNGAPSAAVWKVIFSQIRRFLRLRARIGWTVIELDRVLTALGKTLKAGDEDVLTDLATVERLRDALDMPLVELAAWWGNIDTEPDLNGEGDERIPSLYEKTFLAPPQASTTFDLNTSFDEFAHLGLTIAAKSTEVAGALRVSRQDLSLLLEHLGGTPMLDLATLSRLFRLVSMARGLKLSIRQLVMFISLSETDPSDPARDTSNPLGVLHFVERVKALKASVFSMEELAYLLQHRFREPNQVALTSRQKVSGLLSLRSALHGEPRQDGGKGGAATPVASKEELVSQTMASLLSLSSDTTEYLLGTVLRGRSAAGATALDDLLSVEKGGLWGEYFQTNDLADLDGTPGLGRIDAPTSSSGNAVFSVSFSPEPEFIDPDGAPFSVKWEGILLAAKSGRYKFKVSTDAGAAVVLSINGRRVQEDSGAVVLRAGSGHTIRLDVVPGAGTNTQLTAVTLRWMTPGTNSWVAVPNTQLVPSVLLQTYEAAYKAGVILSRLNLGADDLAHLHAHGADFCGPRGASSSGFDLDALPVLCTDPPVPLRPLEHVRDVWAVGREISGEKGRFVDLLAAAREGLTQGRSQLLSMSGWDADEVDLFCDWTVSAPDSAIGLLNDLKQKFNAHLDDTSSHGVSDLSANRVTVADANTLASAKELANAIKAAYTAHRKTTGDVHLHVDGLHTVAASDATDDLGSIVVLANELKRTLNAHCGSTSTLDEAITAVNDLRRAYEAHRVCIDSGVHSAADTSSAVTVAEATDLSTAKSLANALKEAYEDHRVKLGDVHKTADTTNAVTANDATDLDSLKTLVNDLKAKYAAHRVLTKVGTSSVHGSADTTNVASAPVVGTADVHRVPDSGHPSTSDNAEAVAVDSPVKGLGVKQSDLAVGRKLGELLRCVKESRRLGIRATQLVNWATSTVNSDLADSVREAVRAKHGDTAWPKVMAPLRDVLRRQQRDALAAYLVDHNSLESVDDLFGELLIDAGMQPCMKTSRLKSALSAIQLFGQRCLMGLETVQGWEARLTPGQEKEWAWRKNYRVWEANKKVFLYPENWMEPDLRDDKTPFFKELEKQILEGEPTRKRMEDVYRRYLDKLLEVSHLEIAGLYEDVQGTERTLHVIGRTRREPRRYYYRKYTTPLASKRLGRWSPWEPVQADMEGNHVLPVVWNGRLRLIWVVIDEKTKRDTVLNTDGTPIKDATTGKTKTEDVLYLTLEFKVSEYSGGVWSAGETLGKREYKDASLALPMPYVDKKGKIVVDKNGKVVMGLVTVNVGGGKEGAAESLCMECAPEPGGDGLTLVVYRLDPSGFDLASSSSERTWCYLTRLGSILFEGTPGVAAEVTPTSVSVEYGQPKVLLQPGYLPAGQQVRPVDAAPKVWELDSNLRLPNDKYRVLPPQRHFGSPQRRPLVIQSNDASVLSDTVVEPVAGVTSQGKSQVALRFMHSYQVLHHAQALQFYRDFNHHGLDGLLAPTPGMDAYKRRRQYAFVSTEANWFETTFSPNTGRTVGGYPDLDVDLSHDGANGVYNWELFFHIPLLIAERFKQDQQFEEAMRWYHYVFDPTTPPENASDVAPKRYWRMRALWNVTAESLEDMLERLAGGDAELERSVEEWRKHPFKPHVVARSRPQAFMKNVVMKYLDNLIEWGDQLFMRDSIESINEASQLYVRAFELLGPKPRAVPTEDSQVQTYSGLRGRGFGAMLKALLESENKLPGARTPFSAGVWDASDVKLVSSGTSTKMASGWEYSGLASSVAATVQFGDDAVAVAPTVESGLESEVNLGNAPSFDNFWGSEGEGEPEVPGVLEFCVPKNPQLLAYWDTVADRLYKIRNCMNIKGVVRTLPLFQPPIDPGLLVRAAAAGVDLATVQSSVAVGLPAYRFRVMVGKALELSGEVRSFGSALLVALEKRDAETLSDLRASHEVKLLQAVKEVRKQQVKEARESLSVAKRQLAAVQGRLTYYKGLKERGLSPEEKTHLSMMDTAFQWQLGGKVLEIAGAIAHAFPEVGTTAGVTPSVTVQTGGTHVGNALRAGAAVLAAASSIASHEATMADIRGRHRRREQEWKHQASQAQKDLAAVSKQVAAAEVRLAIEEQNQRKQLKQAEEVQAFLRSKFTDRDLYRWMVSHTANLYLQAYKLAFEVAKQAERAFEYELGKKAGAAGYIRFGYWDSLRKGLLAGEKLSFDLKRMETAYFQENVRELELTKNISLADLNPVALMKLRATGECLVEFDELLFDLDYPDHYKRRIKAVSLSMPCVAGPQGTVACTLELQSSKVRRTGSATDTLATEVTPACSEIATSHGQNDSGTFELSFGDERYLPFEGAGAVSQWKLSIPKLGHFDRRTLSDVIFHMRYTAVSGRD